MKNDVTFLVIMIAFFALAALFVVACDALIGSDEEALREFEGAPEGAPESQDQAA